MIVKKLFVIPLLFLLSGFAIAQQVAEVQAPVIGTQGMVSSAHPLATAAGVRILKAGGNAFDAAVATATTLNVVEPMNSGMGGYGTILVYDAKSKKVRFLDSSGKIPMNVDGDAYRAPTPNYLANRRGPKAVSTPGNVNAWEALSKEYGILPWKDLFAPAIELAAHGFPVSSRLAGTISSAYDSFPTHAKAIFGKGGQSLKSGQLLIQQDLAHSLKLVSEKGSRVYYEGELAQTIHQAMQARGSFLCYDDLKADKAEWWEPIKIDYKGCQVFTSAPPSTAFPSIIRLGMMSRLDSSIFKHNSADYLHAFAEVTKHAFWCRLKYAGDPTITPPPLELLLSANYWQTQVDQINMVKATKFSPPGKATPPHANTTHFVVADKWGNIVSATQTLGNSFGSRIMPKGTGIWFNNSLAYCTFEPPGNPMDAKPGQRKLSGDCPTIIFKDGKPWAAIGTPGGHTIGQTVPQMVMNLIDFKMNIHDAIAAPRVSFVEPNTLSVEGAIDEAIIAELAKRGHETKRSRRLGNAHGLRIFYDDTGAIVRFEGASDPRGAGSARGY